MKNNVSFVGLCQNGRNEGKKVRREVRKREVRKREEKWRRVWHLWQQKINIAVGRRARACVRRVCAWICTFSKKGQFRRRGEWETLFRFILFENLLCSIFALSRKQNKAYQKKIVQILADFSLFALISTHIVIEGNVKEQQQIEKLTKRKASEKQEKIGKHNAKRHNAEKHNAKSHGAKRNRVRQKNLTHSVKIWKTNLSD